MSTTTPIKTIGTKNSNIQYSDRRAVRLIIHDENNQIIILHADKDDYYKLPGGGVEGDEDDVLAAEREAMEETGCKVDVEKQCMGIVEEYRNDLHQFSYCYIAKLVEDTKTVELTEEELEDGLKHEWIAAVDALAKMKTGQPKSEFGKSVKERDIWFVEEYLKRK